MVSSNLATADFFTRLIASAVSYNVARSTALAASTYLFPRFISITSCGNRGNFPPTSFCSFCRLLSLLLQFPCFLQYRSEERRVGKECSYRHAYSRYIKTSI